MAKGPEEWRLRVLTDSMAQMEKRENPLKTSLGMRSLLAKSWTQGYRKSATMQSGGSCSTKLSMGWRSSVVAVWIL